MFLLIFESIGTTELLLIGSVALIIFGPRKLPQMAKTLGRAMSEFKNTTNEFKSTWEREANFEEFNPLNDSQPKTETSISSQTEPQIGNPARNPQLPEIKEIDVEQFNISKKQPVAEAAINAQKEKQSWL